jgi:hypothetical protein
MRACLLAALTMGSVLLAGPALAALPPNYQRLAELRAILNDTRVTDWFDTRHPIERVEWVKPDLYRVTGGACHLDVGIQDVRRSGSPMPGPRPFMLVPGALTCD